LALIQSTEQQMRSGAGARSNRLAHVDGVQICSYTGESMCQCQCLFSQQEHRNFWPVSSIQNSKDTFTGKRVQTSGNYQNYN